MKFTDKSDYLNQRKTLLDEAQELINDGKIDEGTAKTEDVKNLDNEWEKFATAQANLNALNGNISMTNLVNAIGAPAPQVANFDNNANSVNDMYDSVEYRKAFMENVMHGTKIPTKFQNANANTKTTDVGSVIPTTTMNRIIEKMETVGNIYAKVTKTAFKGGLAIPTSSVKPVASWVAEGTGSDTQKKTTGSITFTYYKLRCAISMSIETDTMALAAFETAFVNNVTEAMIKAIEQSIFTGTGATGKQPTGFLTETVETGQNVDIAKANSITYADLCAAEAVLPSEYETGAEWFMRKSTFFNQIAAMVDSNKQPIARVNVGLDGKPEYRILGRPVVFTDYIADYVAAPAVDTIVAAIFNLKDYVLNTNLDMTVKRYEDNETDDQVTKAIMLVDGKVADKHSLVTITKKSA